MHLKLLRAGRTRDIVGAKFTESLILRGLQGQHVGEVTGCEIDLQSGRIVSVELSTSWQTLNIPWQRVEFDGDDWNLRLVRSTGEGAD